MCHIYGENRANRDTTEFIPELSLTQSLSIKKVMNSVASRFDESTNFFLGASKSSFNGRAAESSFQRKNSIFQELD